MITDEAITDRDKLNTVIRKVHKVQSRASACITRAMRGRPMASLEILHLHIYLNAGKEGNL